MSMWKSIRVAILLLILAVVAINRLQEQRSLNWQQRFYVGLYPINVDHSPVVQRYLDGLHANDFSVIASTLNSEAQRYGVALSSPIQVQLGPQIADVPPAPPQDGSLVNVILWSLKLRYYAWTHNPDMPIRPNVRLYLLYYDPAQHNRLSHSTALDNGRVGRVNVFASSKQVDQNLVVIAHELLHTFGATDKYDLGTNLPFFPSGYAAPQQVPLYPQQTAELMGGRVPVTAQKAVMPESLRQVLVGNLTAREIGWVKQ
jgi:hypothetical protein